MITKTAIIGDLHIPYQDKDSVELALSAFESINVDRIIINGDLADFYNVNSHGPTHPDIAETLEDELNSVRDWLEQLRERFPTQHIVYLFGNHSNRLERFILKNAKTFWNIVTPEKYFRLKELDIEYYPYNTKYQIENTNLYVQHSPASYAVNAAMNNLKKKLDVNMIYGCTHRAQVAHLTSGNGEIYSCYMNGWLGDNKSKVYSYTRGHDNWQQSVCMVTTIDQTNFNVELSIIRDGILTIDGRTFRS